MNETVRVAVVGLGPIGLAIVRSVRRRPWAHLVGAVDVREELAGTDVGDLVGGPAAGVAVTTSLDAAGAPGATDVVILSTGSHLRDVTAQVLACLAWGASVVSTCEELAYPWFHHPDEAARIDAAARNGGRVVLATGVNPGFAMDALALAVSGIAERVDGVEVVRVVDAATRRGPLQLKVGAGISEAEFLQRRAHGRIGHVGLVESVAMLAAGFGWSLDRIDETLEPVLAERSIRTDIADIPAGSVAGIRQRASGAADGRTLVRLDLDMYVGAPDAGDTLHLLTDPPITAHVSGLHGDVATAAICANAVRVAPDLRPGLRTMLDVVPLRAPGANTDIPFANDAAADAARRKEGRASSHVLT